MIFSEAIIYIEVGEADEGKRLGYLFSKMKLFKLRFTSIELNGKRATLGTPIHPGDKIALFLTAQ